MKNIKFFKVPRLVIPVTAASIWGGVYAAEATLCQSHEEIYFSCLVGENIISLCASGNISPKNGYVQYRFGASDRVELEFPSKPYPPQSRFLISDVSEGGVKYTHVKFRSGRYDYVIYQGFPSGLYIKNGGRLVSNLICEPGDYQQLSSRAYRGMRTVLPVDGIDN